MEKNGSKLWSMGTKIDRLNFLSRQCADYFFLRVREFLTKKIPMLPNPPYRPDVAPCDQGMYEERLKRPNL